MFKRIRKTDHKCRQAFTLVELIVVLVILAVLAAILVPALTGYIKKSKREKFAEEVYNAREACQAVMPELYGLGPGAMTNQTGSATGGGDGGDVRWDAKFNTGSAGAENLKWGNKVLQLMDRGRGTANREPYILIFGVGHPDADNLTLTQKYTVYYVAYVRDKNSPAIFYVNGEYVYKYPKDAGYIKTKGTGKDRNILVTKDGDIPLQLYVVSTYQKDNFWTGGSATLQGHAEPNFKG